MTLVEISREDAAREDVLAVIQHLAWQNTPDELLQISAPYRRGDQRLFGLEVEDRIVCCVGIRDTTHGPELRSLATLPEHQRRGLASRLIEAVAAHLDLDTIWAETDNDAVDFYRSNGFTIETLGELHPGTIRYRCTRTFD